MFDGLKKFLNKDAQKKEANGIHSILVVEDNEIDRVFIKRTLERYGYKVTLAPNGEEGLRIALEKKPDLILMDCEMPVMDGVEACKRLKETEETQNIPVIFLTSVNTPLNILSCFELEAENFLAKPVNPKLLASHIETTLKQKTSQNNQN